MRTVAVFALPLVLACACGPDYRGRYAGQVLLGTSCGTGPALTGIPAAEDLTVADAEGLRDTYNLSTSRCRTIFAETAAAGLHVIGSICAPRTEPNGDVVITVVDAGTLASVAGGVALDLSILTSAGTTTCRTTERGTLRRN